LHFIVVFVPRPTHACFSLPTWADFDHRVSLVCVCDLACVKTVQAGSKVDCQRRVDVEYFRHLEIAIAVFSKKSACLSSSVSTAINRAASFPLTSALYQSSWTLARMYKVLMRQYRGARRSDRICFPGVRHDGNSPRS